MCNKIFFVSSFLTNEENERIQNLMFYEYIIQYERCQQIDCFRFYIYGDNGQKNFNVANGVKGTRGNNLFKKNELSSVMSFANYITVQ